MSQRIILDSGENELMRNLANFASRKAINDVYTGTFYSKSVGAKIMVVVAVGEQAEALQRLLMANQVPDEAVIINTPGGKDFLA